MSVKDPYPHNSQENTTDLQSVSEHCNHLEEQGRRCSGRTCLGYLSDQCTIHFYLQPVEQDNNNRQPLSLDDLIRQTSEDPLIQVLPRPRIMSFASSIADAVLQFYSSPWLPERWDSKDIYFLGNKELNETEEPLQIRSLYVSLRFGRESKGKGVMGRNRTPLGEHTPSAFMAQDFDVGIRNERLFCLGIVLLELGYTKPWDVLRSSIMTRVPAHPDSNYLIAETLARGLVSHMGMNYVRVVRKCIGCDFGLGETNLDDDELQKKFVEDVIEALRSVGAGLSALF